MARGGRRTYTRDSRGRFASTPGGGLGAARKAARSQSGRTSTLGARTSLKASRAKLRAKDPADQRLSTALSTRAQKGAVTRGNRGLKAAKTAAQTRIAGGMKGVIGKTRKAPKVADANPLKQVRRNRKRGPMTERLRVALEVSRKVASKKQVTADRATEELLRRQFFSALSRKAGKATTSKKEDAARVKSAQATKSWQKAEKRADTLLEAYRNRIAAIKKAAPGKLRPGQTKALTRKNPSGVTGTTKKSSQGSRKPAASADKSASPPSRAKSSRARLPGMGGTIAKPKGLKPGVSKRQVKPTPARIASRPKEQQDKRNLIARALREMPKEKRAKFIKARKQIEAEQAQKKARESARSVDSSQSRPSIQKQRWAKKAEVYANAAIKNKERAASLEFAASRFSRDWNFISQPGNFSARKRVNSQQDKAFELRRKARQQELRAKELRRLATTNKGDAERERQSQRDKVSVEKGSRISTLMYGPGKVVRVNKKTVSYLVDRTGSVINVDKSWVTNS